MGKQRTGIDVGLRTAKALRGKIQGNSFQVTGFALASYRTEDPLSGWYELNPGFKPSGARVGLTGRDVNIRYTRVPRVPDWQLRKLMRFEVEEIGGQSGAEVASDFNVLPEMPEIEDEDVVLLGMAREELLAAHGEGLAAVGGSIESYTPNAIALYNAWLRYGVVLEDTVLVANIGHDSIDVALVRGTDLLFARNMSGGSGLFDQALVERLGIGAAKAEAVKCDHVDLSPGAQFSAPTAEKASRACLGPAGQLLSLLESTVLFCKSQLKLAGLRIDRVMLCGGGAALKGLDAYLANGMKVSVELFDPFIVVDTQGLSPEEAGLLEEHRLESVVALGLATTASDPAAYSVEIIPAALRKRREFWGGTAFLLAAALLGLLFLVYKAQAEDAVVDELRDDVAALRRQVTSRESADRKTRALLDENARRLELVQELYVIKGAGEQLARVVDSLGRSLPGDFWLTRMSSREAIDEELGVYKESPQPIVHLEGRMREGTERVVEVFEEFYGEFALLLDADPGRELKPQTSVANSSFAIDVALLAPARDQQGESELEER